MVSTLSRNSIARTCANCPFWQPSDRTPNVGRCCQFDQITLGNEPASDTCEIEIAGFADTMQPALELGLVDRALPPSYHWEGATLFGLIQTDRAVWDVSVQHPYRKFLGRIELSVSGWIVTNVDRQPHNDGVRHPSYTEAAKALLKLARNPVERANGGRLSQWTAGLAVAAIAIATLAPGAIATEQGSTQTTQSEQPSLYRGSGR
jgi:hypothetical protein